MSSKLNAEGARIDIQSAFDPVSQTAATVAGLAVSTDGYQSGKLYMCAGVGGGTVDAVVQTSADGSTNWVALNDEDGNQYTLTQIDSASESSQLAVDFTRSLGFVRANVTVASATSLICGAWIRCGARSLPVADGLGN